MREAVKTSVGNRTVFAGRCYETGQSLPDGCMAMPGSRFGILPKMNAMTNTEQTGPQASCDLVLVSWNEPGVTRLALDSIRRLSDHPYRLIVVDNASNAETVAMLEEAAQSGRYGEMTLICNPENLGWIKAINQGIERSRAKYVCLLNNDVVATPGWLRHMVEAMERNPAAGLANPQERQLRNVAHSDWNAYAQELSEKHRHQIIEIDYASGFCMMIRRELADRIGKFDEIFGMGYYEDEDFSRRALAIGYRCIRVLDALVLHHVSVSFGKDVNQKRRLGDKNRLIYENRWGRHHDWFVLANYPAGDELLRLARDRHVMYVVDNKHVNPSAMLVQHANIKFRGGKLSRQFPRMYFLIKGWQLKLQGRVKKTVVLSDR